MPRSAWKVATLLFFSGACALVYETVWIRELRLVFGASTAASACVVACFVGGLGVGGLVFGPRADRHESPLSLYASLEALIAASAATTPLWIKLVRALYVASGGTPALGDFFGTVLRLFLSALVFALPTVLMGGSLPAAARAIGGTADGPRKGVALLYGVNTIGAVLGCLATTFVLFEALGTRSTLWIAALINVFVAVFARVLSRRGLAPVARDAPPAVGDRPRARDAKKVRAPSEDGTTPTPPRRLVLACAAVTGFAFCLMELVWYRMLAPILGGSVFTFGVVLTVALAGMGFGSVAYAALSTRRLATLRLFTWSCGVEALALALPYAWGDGLAVLAAVTRPVGGALGFGALAIQWTLIASLVVLPASLVTGFQFPLLVALLGRADRRLGSDVGRAYALNTAGSVAGSLAGGFGLIPLMSAPGCWVFVVVLLVALALGVLAQDVRRSGWRAAGPALVAAVAVLALGARGPTAGWRHGEIGAGRVSRDWLRAPNAVREFLHRRRRFVRWETDGRESSVGIETGGGVAFLLNGRADGSARGDAGTSVMLGLIGAVLHPHPTRAMVIGLGTGATAGWLGAIPTVSDVDVAEIEPAVLEVARRSTPVNEGVLDNPRVRIAFGDARELLECSDHDYDLIVSEPSNPYRAGIASLFTVEFYETAAKRLSEGGFFLQWVQGYEIDGQTLRTIYATLSSVFPNVETWEGETSDLLLLASKNPVEHDVARLRERITQEPVRSALVHTWRADGLEAFFAHYVAPPTFARDIAALEGDRLNTDDRNLIEFRFARSVGQDTELSADEVRKVARVRDQYKPALQGVLDWDAVDDEFPAFRLMDGASVRHLGRPNPERTRRISALSAFATGDVKGALREWRAQSHEPSGPTELWVVANGYASAGDDTALRYIEALKAEEPVEALLVAARLRMRQARVSEAAEHLQEAFARARSFPWSMESAITSGLALAVDVARAEPKTASRLLDALSAPFALLAVDDVRMRSAVEIASVLPPGPACVAALEALEPWVPWDEAFLERRAKCYVATQHPLAEAAQSDLRELRRRAPPRFSTGLVGEDR